jgi:hypothetical protein
MRISLLCLENGIHVNHIEHHGRSILFQILPKLRDLNYTTWDTDDSIKLCLAWGLDIFPSRTVANVPVALMVVIVMRHLISVSRQLSSAACQILFGLLNGSRL